MDPFKVCGSFVPPRFEKVPLIPSSGSTSTSSAPRARSGMVSPPVFALKTRSQPGTLRSPLIASSEGDRVDPASMASGSLSPGSSDFPPFASWAQLFRAANPPPASTSAASLKASAMLSKIHEATSDEVVIDPVLLESSREKWRSCLLGKFLGRPPPTHIILRDAKAQWDLSCSLSILEMAGGFFCFRFQDDYHEDFLRVLADGPWSLGGRVISLMPWREDFHPLTEKISTAPVWLRFEALPQEYWHTPILESLANCFGKFLKIDDFTLRNEKARFARVCVEVDLSKPLKAGARIGPAGGLFFQSVAYENLPVFCYSCGHLGHNVSSCPSKPKPSVSSSVNTPGSDPPSAPDPPIVHSVNASSEGAVNSSPQLSDDSAGLGPWLRVERRRGRALANRPGRRSPAGHSRSPSDPGRSFKPASGVLPNQADARFEGRGKPLHSGKPPRGSSTFGRGGFAGAEGHLDRSFSFFQGRSAPHPAASASGSVPAGRRGFGHVFSASASGNFSFGSSAPKPTLDSSEDLNLALVVVDELKKVHGTPIMDIDGSPVFPPGKGKRGRSRSAKSRKVSEGAVSTQP